MWCLHPALGFLFVVATHDAVHALRGLEHHQKQEVRASWSRHEAGGITINRVNCPGIEKHEQAPLVHCGKAPNPTSIKYWEYADIPDDVSRFGACIQGFNYFQLKIRAVEGANVDRAAGHYLEHAFEALRTQREVFDELERALLPKAPHGSVGARADLSEKQPGQDEARLLQETCSSGDSFSITSSLLSQTEGCYAFAQNSFDEFYTTVTSQGIVVALDVDTDDTDPNPNWVLFYYAIEDAQFEDPRLGCVSEETVKEASHPTLATWSCDINGEVQATTAEEFSAKCGCSSTLDFDIPVAVLDSATTSTIAHTSSSINVEPTTDSMGLAPTPVMDATFAPAPVLKTGSPEFVTASPVMAEPTPSPLGSVSSTSTTSTAEPTSGPMFTATPTSFEATAAPMEPQTQPTAEPSAPVPAPLATFSPTTGKGTSGSCSASAVSDAEAVQLGLYDRDLYLDPDCAGGVQPLPMHCNFFGLGQECRSCFLTCDGAMTYMEDFASEIAVWGTDVIINFCKDAAVDSIDDC